MKLWTDGIVNVLRLQDLFITFFPSNAVRPVSRRVNTIKDGDLAPTATTISKLWSYKARQLHKLLVWQHQKEPQQHPLYKSSFPSSTTLMQIRPSPQVGTHKLSCSLPWLDSLQSHLLVGGQTIAYKPDHPNARYNTSKSSTSVLSMSNLVSLSRAMMSTSQSSPSKAKLYPSQI